MNAKCLQHMMAATYHTVMPFFRSASPALPNRPICLSFAVPIPERLCPPSDRENYPYPFVDKPAVKRRAHIDAKATSTPLLTISDAMDPIDESYPVPWYYTDPLSRRAPPFSSPDVVPESPPKDTETISNGDNLEGLPPSLIFADNQPATRTPTSLHPSKYYGDIWRSLGVNSAIWSSCGGLQA